LSLQSMSERFFKYKQVLPCPPTTRDSPTTAPSPWPPCLWTGNPLWSQATTHLTSGTTTATVSTLPPSWTTLPPLLRLRPRPYSMDTLTTRAEPRPVPYWELSLALTPIQHRPTWSPSSLPQSQTEMVNPFFKLSFN